MSLSLETRFDTIIEQLDTHILSAARVYPLLDLTRLDEAALAEDIDALVAKAQQEHVAAVCVFPQHLAWIPPLEAIWPVKNPMHWLGVVRRMSFVSNRDVYSKLFWKQVLCIRSIWFIN